MGITHFILAVNKMDLVDYSEDVFNKIRSEFLELTRQYSPQNVWVIPVSATAGDNVTTISRNTPWYDRKTLLETLETAQTDAADVSGGFVMPVQRASRPHHNFRGFQGEIESGRVQVGDEITVLPSGQSADSFADTYCR